MKRIKLVIAAFVFGFLFSFPICCEAKENIVITIDELKSEGERIKKDVNSVLKSAGEKQNCELVVVKSNEEFIAKWNSIEDAGIVILSFHGDTECISDNNELYLAAWAFSVVLKKIKCDCVLLLSCQGGTDVEDSGVGNSLCKMVSGYVVASDGLVVPGILNCLPLKKQTFECASGKTKSIENKETENIEAKGWVIYRYNKNVTHWNTTYVISKRYLNKMKIMVKDLEEYFILK